jgi:hypothetical protein
VDIYEIAVDDLDAIVFFLLAAFVVNGCAQSALF